MWTASASSWRFARIRFPRRVPVQDADATIGGIKAALPNYGYNDYLRQLPAVEKSAVNGRPLRVAVLRSCTIEPIEPILRLRLIVDGFHPSVFIGGYNQYVQEIVDPASRLHTFRPDIIILMIRLEDVMPDFVDDFGNAPAAEWEQRIASKARELGTLAARAEKAFGAQVIVQNMTLADRGYFGLYDAQRPTGQPYLVQELNRALAAALSEQTAAFVWDFDRFVRIHGHERLYDAKMWYVARNPYKQSAYPLIVDDLACSIRACARAPRETCPAPAPGEAKLTAYAD